MWGVGLITATHGLLSLPNFAIGNNRKSLTAASGARLTPNRLGFIALGFGTGMDGQPTGIG